MSLAPVSFTFVGSIVWTISCVSVPAPATGDEAVKSTVAPGLTVAADALRDSAFEDAEAVEGTNAKREVDAVTAATKVWTALRKSTHQG